MTDEEILKIMEVVQEYGRRHVPIKGTTFSNGASKCCYIFHKENFVIKYPRNRPEEERISDCQLEVNFYQDSVKYRVQQILLPTSFIGTNSYGIPFYKQTKISCDAWNMPRESYERYMRLTSGISEAFIEKIRRSFIPYNQINTLWLKMIWRLYGEKFMRSFEEWINENNINDLHDSNIGYLNHKPVMLDFSGYHG